MQGTQKTNLLASGEGNAVADSGSQARAWEPTGLQALPGRAVEIVGLTSCFSIRFAAQCTSRIEDPVEFVFQDVKSLVNQREVGECVKDFATAMKHAVREDPDVILVGEMRDAESFETALHAAETGHLVFGTVHASSASTTIGRILDLFPQAMHKAIRSSMAFNIKAVIAQRLLPTVVESPRRVPIAEIMLFNATVRKLVLGGEDDRLSSAVSLGRPEGMQTFEDSLFEFVEKEYLSRDVAIAASPNPDSFKMRLKGIGVKSSGLL